MPTFLDVQQALDRAIDGAEIHAHRAFWRGISRDQFVTKVVYGHPVVVVGNASDSNIVKALRGELPFGADTGTTGATIARMPARRPAMAPADLTLICEWINQGCPE